MSWVKRHKFWTSVLLWFVLSMALSPWVDPFVTGRWFGAYVLVGIIVKIANRKKKGNEEATHAG